jgi:hypothetical protein
LTEVEEFMVIKAQAAIAAIKMAHSSTGFVDASKSNGPCCAGAMQLEEGSHLELKE